MFFSHRAIESVNVRGGGFLEGVFVVAVVLLFDLGGDSLVSAAGLDLGLREVVAAASLSLEEITVTRGWRLLLFVDNVWELRLVSGEESASTLPFVNCMASFSCSEFKVEVVA